MGDWTLKTEDVKHVLQVDIKAEQEDNESHCKLECKDFNISGACSLKSESLPGIEESFAENDIDSIELDYVKVKVEDPNDLEYILDNQLSNDPAPVFYEEPERYYGSSQDISLSITSPVSAAEKQRRYRARRDADPERRQKYLQYERQRWRRDLQQGKKKIISDLSELERIQQRYKWRKQYMKRKVMADVGTHSMDTPIILSNIQSSIKDLQDRSVSIMAPISAAEKQRRYRARRDADPERREKYLQGERQRWRRDVEQGKKKTISDLSELWKMEQLNKWREYHSLHHPEQQSGSSRSENNIEQAGDEL
ncbi:uncharacterized protein LOC111193354 isoform X2 [Astyanax mexicanus]|uniref:uncharacterized protein LOC111193354 isoform X2 n=1 Tax=Astyanax mexicanus TaxID=7994 RepID=UPI0020CB2786|nr:uncharacterized protein LOC111193354 isoform X2 [Astyanax mexicanus]